MAGPHDAWLPAAPEAVSRDLRDVLAGLSSDQLSDRLRGFREMLADLPDVDVMKPAVETLRDLLAAELAARLNDLKDPDDAE